MNQNQTPVPLPVEAPSQPNVNGVLASRMIGFCVDFVLISILWAFFMTALFMLGFATLGLTWLLLPTLFPLVALLYNGFTVSGRKQATPGMRLFGVRMQMAESGGEVSFLIAAIHAIFYYVSVTVLTPLILLVGLVRSDSRMLHDLLAGVIVVRKN